jgi:hypothetical protein
MNEIKLEEIGFTHERANMDCKSNNYGSSIIDMCKNLGMFIINGRVGKDKGIGKLTCKNKSVVDYGIATPELVPLIVNFEVLDFCEILSDVHCPLIVTLQGVPEKQDMNKEVKKEIKTKVYVQRTQWQPSKKDDFVSLLNDERIHALNDDIAQLKPITVKQSDMNNIYNELCNIIMDSGYATQTIKNVQAGKVRRRMQNKEEWFNDECESMRKQFNRAKNEDKRLKSDGSKYNRRRASNDYKMAVKKCKREYKNDFIKSLKMLKGKDPKEYWKLLTRNSKGKETNDITIDDFCNHFKNLSTVQTDGNDESLDINSLTVNENVQLNKLFTEKEILFSINKLKNNKAAGSDNIINEFIKASSSKLLQTYTDYFNLVLNTGIAPDAWVMGNIIPIFKKGDKNNPDNYRGITLLSCLGKVFTSTINERLAKFVNGEGILGEEQAGFRNGYSTTDHIFTLHSLLEMYLNKHKKVYCAFVDFKKAFDTVDRVSLWRKLAADGINGRLLTVIHNMYKAAKSCVKDKGQFSNLFNCNVGVRQGENLSPLLFAMYLNDLTQFLSNKMAGLTDLSQDIRELLSDDDVEVFLKLYLLMYADDMILLSETKEDLQIALDELYTYCICWKLTVNVSKTKIMIFSRGKVRNRPAFMYNDDEIEIVDCFSYLGVVFNYNNKFNKTAKKLYDQASKAMYSLLRKSRVSGLPIDTQIELFDSVVAPIILYNSEVWGTNNLAIVNKLQIKYYKLVLGANISTPTVMVLGDLGKCPLELNVKQRMLMYWFKLVTSDNQYKLSSILYQLAFKKDENNIFCTSWVKSIKNILRDIGLPEMWINQSTLTCSKEVFKGIVKRRLTDTYIHKWYTDINNSDICFNYRLYKQDFMYEKYLNVNYTSAKQMFRFRAVNNNIPVNKLRHSGIDRQNRKCILCDKDELGDEFHYLFICNYFAAERSHHIKQYYFKYPNVLKFRELLGSSNAKVVSKLVKFIRIINSALS